MHASGGIGHGFARACDALAPFYGTLEAVTAGDRLQRCRTTFLSEPTKCRRALILGEGTGRFLVELLRTNPRVEVTCVEQSARMIRETRDRLRRHGLDAAQVIFRQCDALTWRPPASTFDLVVRHFFLDCFQPEERRRLIPAVAASATEQACWLVADFRVPPRGWSRGRARALLPIMYGFFRLTTKLSASHLTDPAPFLEAAGFKMNKCQLSNYGFLHSSLWRHSLNPN